MSSKKRIRFVADSTCDIPDALIKKWQITVVPCFINYGGESHADDGVQLVREEFYRRLPSIDPFPTTAAPSPGIAEQLIKTAFEDADHLVIVSVSSKLSAVCNSLRLGMADLPADRVTLVDSRQVSLGMGLQVLVGAEVAEETGDVQQVLDAISRVRANQQVYAAVATMEYLRRSGRVSNLVASVGHLLQIKPVIHISDGDVVTAMRVRTFKSALDKLVELARNEAPLDRLIILGIENPEGIEEVRKRLKDIAPPDIIIGSICPTIGVHLGLGSVGAATLSKKWRQ